MWSIQLFKLDYDDRELTAATEVVACGWLSMGERIAEFENQFSEIIGSDIKSTAVSSGTAALHLALLALDIKEGDEVIVPALTFVADANVVKLLGAQPISADCGSYDNWNITAESIEKCITDRTKAVIVVHFAGYPCDMIPIKALCDARGIKVIEDVAHAPGAYIDGRKLGSWGDIGCFSFFSNKNIAIGEGGMTTTSSSNLNTKIRYLRSHGMTSLTLDRHKGRAISYDVAIPGLNYRMDEIRAALGIVQLSKLLEGNRKRKFLTERYRKNFNGSSITIPFARPLARSESAYHILPILLPTNVNRLNVIEKLKLAGIQSSIHYPSWERFSAYTSTINPTKDYIAYDIAERELTLPLYPTMTELQVDSVCHEIINNI